MANNNRLIESLSSFVPQICKRYLSQHFENGDLVPPQRQDIYTTVLFADVSGFTKLSEMLSQRGTVGSEELGFYLNRYLERLVKVIAKSGGDVLKFAGDAMLVLWPPDFEGEEPTLEERQLQAHRVAQCSLEIQKELHNAELAENISLSVKLGIGCGRASILHIGGVYRRLEYLAVGPPLIQAFESEHACSAGDTICSSEVWELIKDNFTGEEVHDGFMKLLSSSKQVKAISIMARGNDLNNNNDEEMLNRLTRYIPAAVMPWLEMDSTMWSAELRQITVLFVNLGIKLGKINEVSSELLNRVQQVISGVQSAVYMYEGSLNKFLVDDKGSTLIAVFGLPPLAHSNDPSRAILCSLKLQQVMSQIGIQTSIGVTSGLAFCGLVGSRTRREYSVLGDIVNLSARLMQAANGGVLCDRATFLAAQNEKRISFENLDEIKVKGKSDMIQVYAPSYISYKVKVHKVQRVSFTIGRDSDIQELFEIVEEVCDTGRSHAIVLDGEIGTGKTHLLRLFTFSCNNVAKIVWGSADMFSSDKPYFIWKQVFSYLLQLFGSDQTQSERQQWFYDLVELKSADLLPFVAELNDLLNFNFDTRTNTIKESRLSSTAGLISIPNRYIIEYNGNFRSYSYLSAPEQAKYNDSNSLSLEDIDFILERSKVAIIVDLCKLYFEAIALISPVIIIIDECQYANSSDWKLTSAFSKLMLNNKLNNFLLIVATRDMCDLKHKPKFSPVPKEYVEFRSTCNRIVTVGNLTKENTIKLLAKTLAVNNIEEVLANTIYAQTGGCASFILKYLEVLRSLNSVVISGNSCCFSDWTINRPNWQKELPLPYSVTRVTAAHIDKLSPSILMILKTAAVICYASNSTSFRYDTLLDSHPIQLYKSTITLDIAALINCNMFTCDHDATQLVDAGGSYLPSWKLGFTYGFIADVLYHVLLFQQRRIIHRLAEAQIKKQMEHTGPIEGYFTADIIERHHQFGLDSYDGTVKSKLVFAPPKSFLEGLFSCCTSDTQKPSIDDDSGQVEPQIVRRKTKLLSSITMEEHVGVSKTPRTSIKGVGRNVSVTALTQELLTTECEQSDSLQTVSTSSIVLSNVENSVPKLYNRKSSLFRTAKDDTFIFAENALTALRKLNFNSIPSNEQDDVIRAMQSLDKLLSTKTF